MLTLALCSLLLARADTQITFESPGVSVQAFCEELSRQTGKKYAAFDSVRNDLLALHLERAPLDEVLTRLQYVERAKIDFDGVTYRLLPDEVVREKLRAAWLADRAKSIKSMQDHLRSFARNGPLSDADAKGIALKISDLQARMQAQQEANSDDAASKSYERLQDQLLRVPTGNAFLQLFLAIPAEELAAVQVDGTAVWSTSPTSVERPTPIDKKDLLEALAADQGIWNDASAKFLSAGAARVARTSKPVNSNPVALLRLEVIPGVGSMYVWFFTGFDADGKKLFELFENLMPEDVAAPSIPKPDGDAKPMLVPLPSANEKLIELWGSVPPETEMAKWVGDSALRQLFFDPEKHDPIAETFGQAVLLVAKARHKQLIASETTEFALRFPTECIGRGNLGVSAFERSFSETPATLFPHVQYVSDEGWITARPGLIGVRADVEVDRPSLGTLYRLARDTGTLQLMDVAKYAASKGSMLAYRSFRLLPFLVPSLSGFELLKASGWEIMSFLGRLDDVQISAAQQSEGLALSGCIPHQLESLANAFEMERFEYQGQTNVWRSYPTDALPTGLPGGGVLHLSIESGTAIRARVSEEQGYVEDGYWSIDKLAGRLADLTQSDREKSYRLLGLTSEASQTFVFTFDFPGGVTKVERLYDYRPLSKEVTTVEGLPEPLRGQLKDAIARMSPKKN